MDIPAECSLDGAHNRVVAIYRWHIHNYCLHSTIFSLHLSEIFGVALRCE